MGMAAAEQQFHILAVDDSLLDRKLIERLLKISSYKVTTVDSGFKALEFLGYKDDVQGNPIQPSISPKSQMEQKGFEGVEVNLIITDYCMPGMNGYDLLKKIKESSSLRIRNIPVVILSSEIVPSRISRCLEGGAEEFFIKPMRLPDINKLRPHIIKAKYDVDVDLKEEGVNNNTDLLKTEEKQQQSQQVKSEEKTEVVDREQQPLQSNKRKSIEEGLSPDRTRHRYSGLTVV